MSLTLRPILLLVIVFAGFVGIPRGAASASDSAQDGNVLGIASMRLGHQPVSHVLAWLRHQASVRSALLGDDGRTVDIRFRDGSRAAILPSTVSKVRLPLSLLHAHLHPLSGDHAPAAAAPAVVMEPFASQLGLGPHAGDTEVSDLQSAGYSVDQLYDTQVSVNALTTLAQYNVTYMQTHAGVVTGGEGIVASGEPVNGDPNVAPLVRNGSVIPIGVSGSSQRYYGITSSFITNYEGQFPAHSLEFLNGCNLLSAPRFWAALQAKGAGVLVSWDREATSTDNFIAGVKFFQYMDNPGTSVASAIAAVRAAGFGTSQVEGTTANLGYLGDGTITLGNAAAAPEKTPQPGTPTPGLPVATGQPANSGPTPTALVLRTPIPTVAVTAQPTATTVAQPTAANTPVPTPTPSPTTTPVPTPQPMLSPSITLYPGTQAAGVTSGVTVTGGGFQGGESVSVSYVATRPDGSKAVEHVTGNVFPNGTFVIPNLPVPTDVGAGSYLVTAVGQLSGRSASASLTVVPAPTPTATATFTPTPTNTEVPTPTPSPTTTPIPTPQPLLVPSITLYPGTQPAGVTSGVTVSGEGFRGSETVSVSYVASRPDGSTVVEQATGTAFPDGTFVIPNLPVSADVGTGSYLVTAVGQSSGKSASASLTLVPAHTTTPSASPTLTFTATPTAIPVPTFTVTAPPHPKASVLIDKVLILHHVNDKNVASQQVRMNKATDFFVLYHLANAGSLKPSASLTVTRNGRPMKVPKLHSVTLGHHAAFTARITFTDKRATGKFYAHFHLNLGSASVKRDRKFYVAGG